MTRPLRLSLLALATATTLACSEPVDSREPGDTTPESGSATTTEGTDGGSTTAPTATSTTQ